MTVINCQARAKINLHLHITGRATNGYHLLDSLVAFTTLHDDINIRDNPPPSRGIHLHTKGEIDTECSNDDNLIVKAAQLLASHYNLSPDILIELDKSIPVGAGLGGGSSDAAATLNALCNFWNLTPPADLLPALAGKMGSDIVACLNSPTPVIMRDTGNTLRPAPQLPILYAVLVNPRSPCATPLVYKTYAAGNPTFSDPITFPDRFNSAPELCDFLNKTTRNDLTEAAIHINNDVGMILKELENLQDSLLSRVSGSGSTCFAIFETKEKAISNANRIKSSHPNWWVQPTEIK